MPRLPRNVSGNGLARKLRIYGYIHTRQTGSHLRLSSTAHEVQHHVTIPRHRSLRVGTLNAILTEVASHLGRSKDDVVAELFRR